MSDSKIESINISPDVWGPHFWRTMECIASTMNLQNKKNVKVFFDTLQVILPCEKCRNHYRQYNKDYPLQGYLYSPLTLLLWLYRLKTLIKERQERNDVPTFSAWIDHMVETYDVPELYYYMDKTEEMIRMMDSIGMKHHHSPYYHKFRIPEYKKYVVEVEATKSLPSTTGGETDSHSIVA